MKKYFRIALWCIALFMGLALFVRQIVLFHCHYRLDSTFVTQQKYTSISIFVFGLIISVIAFFLSVSALTPKMIAPGTAAAVFVAIFGVFSLIWASLAFFNIID